MTRLLVIVSDRVSDWVMKGEVVDRYFNPGQVFDHVDLLLTNDDSPALDALARMAGRATIAVHNLPAPHWLFVATIGWQPELLRRWRNRAVALARDLRPDLVRCHGVRLNALAALHIRRELQVPYVVSVHANLDTDHLRAARAPAHRQLAGFATQRLERSVLRGADLVMPVYESIVPYLERLGVERVRVVYNAVGATVRHKTNWAVDARHVRTACVCRQEEGEKDPRPIIEAVAAVPGVHLHLIGDGPLHGELRNAVDASGAADRFTLTRSLPNTDVLGVLAAADLYLYRSSLFEVSKSCMEAALTGLPIVVNDRDGDPAPELRGDHVVLVDGTAAGYQAAIERLLAEDDERARLGAAARSFALAHWDPARVEAEITSIYRALMR